MHLSQLRSRRSPRRRRSHRRQHSRLLRLLPQAPTAEPTPALEAGDPALELGAPDGVDTFDSAVNFAPMESKCFQSEITGGQFVMAAKGLAGVYCWTTSWPQIQDFYSRRQ